LSKKPIGARGSGRKAKGEVFKSLDFIYKASENGSGMKKTIKQLLASCLLLLSPIS
jgi:hypothetical protein